MIKAVVFDYDGVLEDTFDQGFQAIVNVAKKLGKKQPTKEEFRRYHVVWGDFCQKQGYTEEMKKISLMFDEEMTRLDNGTKFFDGMENVVSEMAKKFRLAIVSGGHERRIKESLKKGGILHFFDAIIGLESSENKTKPNAYPIILCAKKLSLLPSEICYVGDSVEDILAGRNAGVAKVVAVSYGYQPKENLLGADILVDSPQELLAVLEELE